MQGNQKRIVVFVLALAIILVLSTQFQLFGNDWGTGLSVNTSTQKYEHYGHYNQKNKKFMYTDISVEQLDSDRYITSWQPGQYSVKIVTTGHLKTRNYLSCYTVENAPDFLVGQYAWIVQYEDTNGHFKTVIDGTNNWFDANYVHITSGNILGNLPNIQYKRFPWIYNNINPFGDNTWAGLPPYSLPQSPETGCDWSKWVDVTIPTLSFQIKGQRVGAVRVYAILEIAEINGIQGINAKWIPSTNLATEDWAYLPSGDGDFTITNINSIGNAGTETTPETGKVYTKYVFEEGSTIHIEVDTRYSGTSLEPGQEGYNYGWELRIYKPGVNNPVYRKSIPDDVRSYPVDYTVPEGSFVPGGNNEWRVELWNTLFMQKETRLFVVDRLEKIPGKTIITTDKTNYLQGDTVYITMDAYANPNGTGEIDHFRVWAKYDSPTSTDYAMPVTDVPATRVSGLHYRATASFVLSKGDKYVYIRAHAIDGDGRAGPEGTKTIHSEEVAGNYRITVTVLCEGTPVSDAKVQIGQQIAYTQSNGKATLWCNPGSYALTVSRLGYNTYRGTVVVNADKEITVNITRSWLPPESNMALLLIALIGIASAVYVGVMYYKKKHPFKR